MKFIFLAPRYHTNQIGAFKKLIENGHDVIFYAHTIGKIEDHDLIEPRIFQPGFISKIFGVGGNTKPFFLPSILNFILSIYKDKPNFIIIRDPSRWFSLLAAITSRLFSVKIIFYTQKNISIEISRHRMFFEKFFLFLFNAIWMSPIKDNFKELNNKNNHIQYVPFCIDGKFFLQLQEKSGPIQILSISKMQKRKEHILLINSLSICPNFDWKLTIIGESSTPEHETYKKYLEECINSNDIKNRVTVINNVQHSEIIKYYEKSDIFILPAKNEPASISILEAMAGGLAVICSDSCGTKTYIKNGSNGYIFKTSNKEDLSNKISLLNNRSEINRMGLNSQKIALNCASPDQFYSAFKEIIFDKWNLTL